MTLAEQTFPAIIGMLRERRGLEPDDNSQDSIIATYPPRKALRELFAWHLGDANWAEITLSWLGDCGFEVKELTEE